MQKIPIYVITGFLGSGKTTLLRHIINSHDKDAKIAIIQNDFSDEMGIEAPTMQDKDGNLFKEFFELPNGCVCCTVKDELLKAIEHLVSMKRFEKILLETTGIADPEPIIKNFWLDCELESSVELSGVITVVDTLNFRNYLYLESIEKKCGLNFSSNSLLDNSDHSSSNSSVKLLSPEIIKQIMLANKIVLNKTDLLTGDETDGTSKPLQRIAQVEKMVKVINPIASVTCAIKSKVSMDWLFDLDAFNIHKVTQEIDRAFHKNALISCHSSNSLLSNISSCTLSFNANTLFDFKSVERVIASIAWKDDQEDSQTNTQNQESTHLREEKLIRFKGIFKSPNSTESSSLGNSTCIYALQGVGQIFEILPIQINQHLENSKFFFLGIGLDRNTLEQLLKSCIIQQ